MKNNKKLFSYINVLANVSAIFQHDDVGALRMVIV